MRRPRYVRIAKAMLSKQTLNPVLVAMIGALGGIMVAIIGPIVTHWLEQESPELKGAFAVTKGYDFMVSGSNGRLQIQFEPGKETVFITNEGDKLARNVTFTLNVKTDQFLIESVEVAPPYHNIPIEILPDRRNVVGSVELLPIMDTIQVTVTMNVYPEVLQEWHRLNGLSREKLQFPVFIPNPLGGITFPEGYLLDDGMVASIKNSTGWRIDSFIASCDDCKTLKYEAPTYFGSERRYAAPIPPPVTPIR